MVTRYPLARGRTNPLKKQLLEALDKRNNYHNKYMELKEQNTALQAENTKLTLRARELEQDGKRLDWLEKAQPNQWHEVTNDFETWDLRQAIDKAMAKAGDE